MEEEEEKEEEKEEEIRKRRKRIREMNYERWPGLVRWRKRCRESGGKVGRRK